MSNPLILASGSEIRTRMLSSAGVEHHVFPARFDESVLKGSLLQQGITGPDLAQELALAKAENVSKNHPDALVLGCDQVLSCGDDILSKPKETIDAARQLAMLRNKTHTLSSAAVLLQNGQIQWETVKQAHLTMRYLTDSFISDYIDRNWDSIRWSVGCYKIEEEGVRLFQHIDGDTFTIQGLPLLDVLSYLIERGIVRI